MAESRREGGRQSRCEGRPSLGATQRLQIPISTVQFRPVKIGPRCVTDRSPEIRNHFIPSIHAENFAIPKRVLIQNQKTLRLRHSYRFIGNTDAPTNLKAFDSKMLVTFPATNKNRNRHCFDLVPFVEPEECPRTGSAHCLDSKLRSVALPSRQPRAAPLLRRVTVESRKLHGSIGDFLHRPP